MRRGLITASGVVAYWPCEDEEGAAQIASAFPGHPPMDFSGRIHGGSNPGLPAATPRLAQSDVFACSHPLPLISDSEWYGTVPDYAPDSPAIIQTRVLIDVPAGAQILVGVNGIGDYELTVTPPPDTDIGVRPGVAWAVPADLKK